ncbi:hypothetical protein [Bradyrhizobium sp. LHD-71]|uniref:hypothetical protein n=1 Tax=Bradyrhizobium sp. LHD-71 TaxID=3072141 RepID=UPI00280ED1F8|nr:hypothetical protein [Bradyrhizobium sp. LHD-71]MDQ8730524.1 hypothetical protein [Bradyrhizobium sp. LHD-71]
MPELDPDDRDRPLEPRTPDPLMGDRNSGIGSLGMVAAVAFAILVGLFFWTMADNRLATNTSPGMTTGMSPTTPAPAPPPSKDGSTPPVSR